MMESFMRLAKSNTAKNLETCGVLAGSLVCFAVSITCTIYKFLHYWLFICYSRSTFQLNILFFAEKQKILHHCINCTKAGVNTKYCMSVVFVHSTQQCFIYIFFHLMSINCLNYWPSNHPIISVRQQMKKRYLTCRISGLYSHLGGFM